MKMVSAHGAAGEHGIAGSHFQFTAAMIGPSCDAGQGTAGTFVSQEFAVATVPGEATLRISALGLYRAFIKADAGLISTRA